jgi:peptidoglycan/xylan/chitin deacetylase (PgdA/CDA1 family)
MRAFCLTVDIDRDVNIAIPGSLAAGSIDRGAGTGPRFSSSGRGLSLLADLLDDIGMKATFFAEASTLRTVDAGILSGHDVGVHGVDHEDFTMIEGADAKRAVLRKAVDAVKDMTGTAPDCFRAPYMRIDEETIHLLPEFGILMDSSLYAEMSPSLIPERLCNGVLEIPVPRWTDADGKKRSAYLWPMHEAKRTPEDYIRTASAMTEGAFVLATHTWHMVESRDKGMMSGAEVEENAENVRKVLEGVADAGIKPMTLTSIRKTIELSPLK